MTEDRFKEIQSIPSVRDSIILKLEHIRRYLKDGKASVMVGAGFSKNAKKSASVKVKDWNELTEDFLNRIYTPEERSELDLKYVSPLRIASLIEATYGRHELEDIIKSAIPDESLSPGMLHEALVYLNWRDIFTMNYDTLIERAARLTGAKYDVVTNRETLFYQSYKRIIKLHGSHPDARPYIITEEDYRTYPAQYPEFVNTVRQALLETVFCLIGFSGEDPNFLEWLGWVRDIMGKRMAPIYMISIQDRRINDAEAALMKARGISLIQRPTELSINEFFEFIFKFLSYIPEPKEWTIRINNSIVPDRHYDYASEESQKNTIKLLQDNREAYPGWLFARVDRLEDYEVGSPESEMWSIQQGIDKITNKDLLLHFIYEVDWKMRMNFSPMFMFDWYVNVLSSLIIDENLNNEASFVHTSTLAVSLMGLYRQRFETEKAEELENFIKKFDNKLELEDLNRFRYEQCLLRLPWLKYDEVYRILEEWSPTSEDYHGVIWKSAVLTEIGEIDQAISMLVTSRQQAQKTMLTTEQTALEESVVSVIDSILNSYPINSKIPKKVEHIKDNPFKFYKYITTFKDSIRAAIQNNEYRDSSVNRIHNFNIDHVTNSFSMDGKHREKELWFAASLLVFWETYGYPLGFKEYSINNEALKLSLRSILTQGIPPYGMQFFVRTGNRDILVKELTREKVCELNLDFIKLYSKSLLERWDEKYARSKVESAKEWRYKNVVVVLLSRLAIFNDQEDIRKTVNILLNLYQNDSPGFDVEFLRCALNSQTLPELSESLRKCLETKLADIHGRDSFFVPMYSYIDYVASEKAFDIVINGLNDESDYVSDIAYVRCARHYVAFKKGNVKALDEAVVKWRNKHMGKSPNAIYSFNLVPHGSTEIKEVYEISELLKTAFDKYLSLGELNEEKVSEPAFLDFLEVIIPLGKRLNDHQTATLIDEIIKYLKIKETAYRNEWSKRFPLFFRDNMHQNFTRITRAVLTSPFTNVSKDKLVELQKMVNTYSDIGLPVCTLLKNINNVTTLWTDKQLYKMIQDKISLGDSEVQEDALDCISSDFNPRIKNLWTKLINSIQYMQGEDLAKYFPALCDLCISQNLKPTDINLAYAIDGVYRNLSRTSKWSGDEYDIQYRIMKILGFYSHIDSRSQYAKLLGHWKEDIEHPNTPNDVKRGYEEGKAAYDKIHNNQEES